MTDTMLALDSTLDAYVKQLRQRIHQHPELAFEETKTSALVASELAAYGYAVTTGIAKTGVVAVRRFGDGPSVAIRADMDALPIKEQNDVPHASRRDGCMHACGHDGHTAMLLGAAKALSSRSDLIGTLILIFQPAEENEGGALAMLEDGLLERFPIDEIYGLHNMPGVPLGTYQVRSGPLLASFDRFDIELSSSGGHGAFPNLSKDGVLAASSLVLALNSIVARDVSPLESAVVSIGHFDASGSYNVMPNRVKLRGSCRALSAETRQIIKRRVTELCNGTAASYGIEIDCRYRDGYPATVNHEAQSAFVAKELSGLAGADAVQTEFQPYMGSEDFAFFLERIPGCYFIMGNGSQSGPLHSPTYDFNDKASRYGVAAWIRIAETALKRDGI